MSTTDILVPTVIGMVIGLLVVVLSSVRSDRAPNAAVIRRGGMTALLVYAVIAAPVLARTGLTLLGLVVSVVFLAIPLIATAVAQRTGADAALDPGSRAVRAVVGTGLAAFVLIAAGQTFALVGKVDPRTTVVAIAVVAGLIVTATGVAGSSRAGSMALWLTILPVLICLGLGLRLGGPAELVPPLIQTEGTDLGAVLGLGVAFVALGWADHALSALHIAGAWQTRRQLIVRVFLGTAVIVILMGLGLLMFLGGAILAPSLQFFVVPANLEMIPVLAVLVMAVAAALFAALVAVILTGVGVVGGPDQREVAPKWVLLAAAAAVILALIDPGSDRVVAVASLAGAALLGADLSRRDTTRGVIAGLVAAGIATVALAATETLSFGWPMAAAIVVVAGVGALAARTGQTGSAPAAVESTTPA